MRNNIPSMFENAKGLADIFEVVKCAVRDNLGQSRGGLMLGLADLGNHPTGWFGAFYPIGTNIIVMNKIPLMRIKETNPELYKPYAFHVLMHEYLHSLGYLGEGIVHQKVYEVSKAVFGEKHIATTLALDTATYFPDMVYPNVEWQPEELKIDLVEGFDRSSVNYIC